MPALTRIHQCPSSPYPLFFPSSSVPQSIFIRKRVCITVGSWSSLSLSLYIYIKHPCEGYFPFAFWMHAFFFSYLFFACWGVEGGVWVLYVCFFWGGDIFLFQLPSISLILFFLDGCHDSEGREAEDGGGVRTWRGRNNSGVIVEVHFYHCYVSSRLR